MKLELKNLYLGFGKKVILKKLNLQMATGKLNLIVGKSGSGKTTLLNAIAGLNKPLEGNILIDGVKRPDDLKFSYVCQNPEILFFNKTVYDEIAYAFRANNVPEDAILERVKENMNYWWLDHSKVAQMDPRALSGGEQRRVALAACTVYQPGIMLFDEPLASLDSYTKAIIVECIKNIAKMRLVIVVTHQPGAFLDSDTNVVLLHNHEALQMTGNDFLKSALKNNSLYPLPEWYATVMEPFADVPRELPMLKAQEVFDFLQAIQQGVI